MSLNFVLTGGSTASASSDKWRRTRHGQGENIAGTIVAADFAALADENGIVPSGVALSYDKASKKYVPYAAASGEASATVLAGFISDQTGVNLTGITGNVGISVATRETIVPKYLPVEAHRTLDETVPTTGVYVFIKE